MEDWLEDMEAVLDTLQTEEADKMLCIEILLQGEVRVWWKMEKEKKSGEELTWKDFHELFLARYFPSSVQERKRKEFLYLIQGNKSVMDYDKEFNKLSRFAKSLVTNEKDRVERCLNGLKMSLQKDLSLFVLPTHAEALDKALKAEWMREMVIADYNEKDKEKAGEIK